MAVERTRLSATVVRPWRGGDGGSMVKRGLPGGVGPD